MNTNRIASLLVLLIGLGAQPTLAAGYIDEMAALHAEGRPIEAFAIAREHLQAGQGTPRFDLYLGLAAVDAGYLRYGISVLERYLLVRPQDPRARFVLARSLYTLGLYGRSRREFQTLLKRDESPQIADAAKPYLEGLTDGDAMEPQAGGYETALHVSRNHTLNVAGFEPLLFPALTEKTRSPNALAGDRTLPAQGPSFGLAARDREAVWEGAAFPVERRSLTVADREDRYRLELRRERRFASPDLSHELVSLGGSWQRSVGERASVTGFAQYARVSFLADAHADAEQSAVGLGLAQSFEGRWRPEVFGAVYLGAEGPVASALEANPERDLYGLRLGAQVTVAPELSLDLVGQVQRREYQPMEPLKMAPRRDEYLNLELGATWGFEPDWSLRASVGYSENESNLEPEDQYESTKAGLSIRYRY